MLPVVILLFAILLATGLVRGEFEWWVVLGFLAAAGVANGILIALDQPLIWSAAIFAGLDIVLVIWVFQGDRTIS